MRAFILIAICCLPAFCSAQSFDWWARTVKWDGVSSWGSYIITQPKYMGPNALPVPQLSNGSIDSSLFLAATANAHFSDGDNTQNISIYGNYCLVKDVISFDLAWVPFERFQVDHKTKEERHVFSDFYYDKQATGELHLNTNIQLLNRLRKHIQLALRIGYRFPCGSGFGAARNTDAPGYYFDVSFGKPLNPFLKWTGMAGFYVWQIQVEEFRQNDAFLFGTGLELNKNDWKFQTSVAGFLGYMENKGDKPIVFRTGLEKKLNRTSLLLRFQQGLHDFSYTSAEVGAKYRLSR
jgi:hypothetical protein